MIAGSTRPLSWSERAAGNFFQERWKKVLTAWRHIYIIQVFGELAQSVRATES